MRRRVVITGMGAITPLGHGVKAMMDGQLAGRSGVGPIAHFDARRFPTTFAAQVKGFELERWLPDTSRWSHSGLNSRFGAAAAQQALTDAGVLDGKVDPARMGGYLGSGEGVQDFPNMTWLIAQAYRPETRKVDDSIYIRNALDRLDAGHEAEQELHTTAAHLAAHFGLEGPNFTCLTACAASSQAIGEATELIRHGD